MEVNMISYQQAVQLIRDTAKPIPSENVALERALNRISASEVRSSINLPPFNNSAMDGFAVKSNTTLNASENNPVILQVSDVLPAGSNLDNLVAGEACAIMTGAPVPDCYDAVVQIENVVITTTDTGRQIRLTSPVEQFENMRFAGEDVELNQPILTKGQKIRPQDIMLLAACGISSLQVYSNITIAIATSGEEISDNYDQPLEFGQIYNANAPLLQNLANNIPCEAHYAGIIGDNQHALLDFINQNPQQILITTGAVSMGDWDFIPQTLKQLGAEIVFHKTAIRPGKPILFAILPDGRYFFGLPGNPVSSFVGWRFFVVPLLRALLGLGAEKTSTAIARNQFHKKHKLRQFLKANLLIDDGVAAITINNGQESFKISPLTTSNVWAISLEEQQINSGDKVQFIPLLPDWQ